MDDIRLPPHSMEAEQSVLGGLLLENSAWDKIAELIVEGDFYRHDHRLIYHHISKLVEQGKPADVITVADSLESSGELASAGGLAYLGTLAQNTPSAANAKHYARLVREQSVRRQMAAAGSAVCELAYGNTSNGVDGLIDEAESRIFALRDASTSRDLPVIGADDLLSELLHELDHRFETGSELLGIPTGLADLDKKTLGLKPGELIILGARPSMGKTSLALQIAEHATKEGNTVLFFSLEMTRLSLIQRLASSVGKIPLEEIVTGRAIADDDSSSRLAAFIGRLSGSGSRLLIRDAPAASITSIRSTLRRTIRESKGVDMVVIDYLQLIQPSAELKRASRYEQVTEISRALKSMTLEFNIPILVLSQLNRDLEGRQNKRPTSADLRDSGQVEQDADIILLLYRDDVYNEDSQDGGIAEIIISKQRNGSTGIVRTVFLGEYTRFENCSYHN